MAKHYTQTSGFRCVQNSPLYGPKCLDLTVLPHTPYLPSIMAFLLTELGLSPPASAVSAWKRRTDFLPHPPQPSPGQGKPERNSLDT